MIYIHQALDQDFYMALLKSTMHQKREQHPFVRFYQQLEHLPIIWLTCDGLLKLLTSNDYTRQNSFSSAEELLGSDTSVSMAIFESFFINISLTKTLNICVQNFYRNQTHVGNLTKSSFYNLLKNTMSQSFFIFDGKCYKQCDDPSMSMGSPLRHTLPNVFAYHF